MRQELARVTFGENSLEKLEELCDQAPFPMKLTRDS